MLRWEAWTIMDTRPGARSASAGTGSVKELQAVGDIAITGIVGGVGSRDRLCSKAYACP